MYTFTTATEWGMNQPSLERIGYKIYFAIYNNSMQYTPWSSSQVKLTKGENVDYIAPLHIVYAETEPRDAVYSKTSLVLDFEPVKLSSSEQRQVKKLRKLVQDDDFDEAIFLTETPILEDMIKVKMKVSLEEFVGENRWGVTKELGEAEFWFTPMNFADHISPFIEEIKV